MNVVGSPPFSCKSAELEIYMERNRIVQGYMDTIQQVLPIRVCSDNDWSLACCWS
jgi:hypothetical protein